MHLMMLGASRHYTKKMAESVAIVSMHLMVLGASRPKIEYSPLATPQKVSMHLMVLGASRPTLVRRAGKSLDVSMHLMVLGASRRRSRVDKKPIEEIGLNAPDGAGCFPTLGKE